MAPTLVRKPFGQVIRNTGKSLEQAYQRFHRRRKGRERFETFCSKNAPWLEDFSIFVVLKKNTLVEKCGINGRKS
jgi:4-alpha-glucanotransferase